MLESLIQCDIVKFLQSKKIFFHSVPNEGAGGKKIRMMQLKTMGLRSGISDLMVYLDGGKLLCLEVKNEKGKQSSAQLHFETTVKNLGFEYHVVRSVSDVEHVLNQHKQIDIDSL